MITTLHPLARVYVSYGHTDPSNCRMPSTLYAGPGGFERRSNRDYQHAIVSWFPGLSTPPWCHSLHEGKLSADKHAASLRLNDRRCLMGKMIVAVVEIELKPTTPPRS
jgi:hypothetical protein